MAGLSSKGEIAVLASLTGTLYVSLHTADPGDTGTSEVSGGAYARQGPTGFTNSGANPTVAANTAIVTFPTATGAWGTITHFGVWDAVTVGNFRGGNPVTTSKPVANGDIARFPASSLTLTAN